MTDPESIAPTTRRGRRVPGAVWALVAILLLWGTWHLVMWGVSSYVDAQIDGTVGDAVEFELEDLEGRTWRAADLRGKVVVLHFFRSNCVSCLAERDAIHALEERLDPERAILLGALLDRKEGYSEATTAATLERLDYDHPILVADEAFIDAFHGAGWSHVTPVTYVIGQDGRVRAALRGQQDLEALLAAIPDAALRSTGAIHDPLDEADQGR